MKFKVTNAGHPSAALITINIGNGSINVALDFHLPSRDLVEARTDGFVFLSQEKVSRILRKELDGIGKEAERFSTSENHNSWRMGQVDVKEKRFFDL